MKFSQLYMNGFGVYRDRTIDVDIQAPAVMLLGRNEAGKSTIMGFIRAMLFGFPTRANMPDRYEPAAGGVHGGSLTLVDASGAKVRLERYEKNGSLKLLYDNGAEAGEAALQAMLGGITPEMYRNLFAFGLGELQKLDALQADEVSGFLFSSGMGLSGGAILQTERKLAGRMESLYKPKGTKQEINNWLKEIDAIEADIRRSNEQSGRFGAVQNDLQSLDMQIRESERALEAIKNELEWHNKCKQARQSWYELRDKQAELSAIPPVTGMPEDAIRRLEQLIADRDSRLERNDYLKLKREEIRQSILHLRYDVPLIERSSELDHLLETAAAYQDAGYRLVELGTEMESEQAEFTRLLRQIDANWTIDQLKRFPVSIGERERIGEFAERFAAVRANKAGIHAELERLSARRQSLERLNGQTFAGMAGGDTWQVMNAGEYESAVRREWEQAKQDAAEFDYAARRFEDAKRSAGLIGKADLPQGKPGSRRAMVVSIAIAALGIAAAIWLFAQIDDRTAASVWVGSLIAALFLFVVVRLFDPSASKASANHAADTIRAELESRMEAARQEVEAIRRRFAERNSRLAELLRGSQAAAEAAATLSTEALPDAKEIIRRWESAIDAFEQQAAGWRAMMEWRREQSVCVEREAALQEEEDSLQAEWTDWLRGYELSGSLLPDTVLHMGQFAEQALQAAERMSRAQSKLSAIRTVRADFEQAAASLLTRSGFDAPVNQAELPISLKRLKEHVDEQLRLKERIRQLQDQEEELRTEHDALLEGLRRIQTHLEELYEQCSVSDEEELRRSFKLQVQRTALEKEIRQLEDSIFRWIRLDQAQKLQETLQQLDEDQLHGRLLELSALAEQTELELNDSRDRRGRLRNELERITSGDDHSALLLSRQERLAAFEQTSAEWMQLAFASELIRKAKEVYERERQPGVLLQASRYFSKITDGKYVRIVSRLGEKALFVEKENGQRVDSLFLSRGTAEQLYLAMRFAIADEYAKTVSLPFVMDDIFVNFDRYRLQQTLSVLSDVARRRQILLFTCHEHVAEAVQSVMPGTQMIELAHTGIA